MSRDEYRLRKQQCISICRYFINPIFKELCIFFHLLLRSRTAELYFQSTGRQEIDGSVEVVQSKNVCFSLLRRRVRSIFGCLVVDLGYDDMIALDVAFGRVLRTNKTMYADSNLCETEIILALPLKSDNFPQPIALIHQKVFVLYPMLIGYRPEKATILFCFVLSQLVIGNNEYLFVVIPFYFLYDHVSCLDYIIKIYVRTLRPSLKGRRRIDIKRV